MIRSDCKSCKHPEWRCKPDSVACICKLYGIGIKQEVISVLGIIGCDSYSYDLKGLTDLERSFYKVKE
jgi:hypothetical protein